MNLRKAALAAYLTICLAGSEACGAITYQIAPRMGYLASWSLDGGWITTDGTIGDIWPSNFESWEFRFTSPSGPSTISSTDGRAHLIIATFANVSSPSASQVLPSLMATEDQLIATPSTMGILELLFSSQDISSGDFTGKAVGFAPIYLGYSELISGRSGSGLLVDNTVDSTDPYHPFNLNINGTTVSEAPLNQSNLNRSYFSTPSGPITIGSVALVPEPSSLLLAVACCLCPLLLWRTAMLRRV